MERRVVITGLGIWSCLGTNLDEVRQPVRMQASVLLFVPMCPRLI